MEEQELEIDQSVPTYERTLRYHCDTVSQVVFTPNKYFLLFLT